MLKFWYHTSLYVVHVPQKKILHPDVLQGFD